LPLRFELIVTETNWRTIYYADFYDGNQTNGWFKDRYQAIAINHLTGGTNTYQKSESYTWGEKQHGMVTIDGATPFGLLDISANEITSPFAESDFWICDLGLEFLHWPGQKILRGDTARGRLCKVLESTNPNPSTNGYSRVLSWIDNETLGIVEAEAYDAEGKKLKEFYPKDIKKVDGQWQVGSMEIDNVQTGSRTRLEFDLKAK